MEGIERIRVNAMLCQIYHYALIDQWETARDLMLMSHLQEHIMDADVLTQIQYNRTMVQLGLSAFRASKIYEHTPHCDIWQNNRARELLAQGVRTYYNQDKSQEEIVNEKRRQTRSTCTSTWK